MFPQHMRFDRDNYIKILWQNIKPGWFRKFDILSESTFPTFGIPYHYDSLLQLEKFFGSKNSHTTMRALDSVDGEHWILLGGNFTPTRKVMTIRPLPSDILWMKRLYGCGKISYVDITAQLCFFQKSSFHFS